jgi:dipeptidyl aminopeptidase/acylaminoacyl peptidase
VSGSAVLLPDGLRAEFRATEPLAPSTEYVLSVPTDVADLAGETLEQPVLVAFTTGSTLALASVFTEEAALVTAPSNGALRAFNMYAELRDDGSVTGYFSIFYPETGARTAGRVTCFTIVDRTWAWVGGVAEDASNPSRIGIEYAWRTADNGPLGGTVPDQLSLAQLLDSTIPGSTAQEWCASTPLQPPGYSSDLVMYNLLSGGIVVTGATVAPPPPPPPAAGVSLIAYFAGPGGIQVIPADGSTGWPLTSARDFNPAWSPDGTRLAFQSDRAQQGNWDIWVINWDRSGLTRLTSGPERDYYPAWSPDGTKIAFARNGSIHLMNVDGSGVTQLSSGPSDRHPTWSPDGSRIAFGGSPGPIWVIKADGSGLTQLTPAGSRDFDPAWSPDGTRIAFGRVLGEAPNSGLHVMNADGSGLRRLTLGINGAPSWSPDGTRLVYELFGMNVINVDGTGITRLGTGFNPVWSPVGTVPPAPVPFRSVQMAGGDGQSAAAGTTLAQPLSVRVVRDDGTPEPGVRIRWNVWTGGQAVSPTLTGAIGSTTDASGIASVQLTLGGSPGQVRVRAALTDGSARAGEVVFTATAEPGTAVTLCCDGFPLGLVNSTLEYLVYARDGRGNGVTGVPITWTVTSGGGSLTPTQDTTAFIGTDRREAYSHAVHTLGPNEGTTTVTATAPTLSGAPQVTFMARVVTAIVHVPNYERDQYYAGDPFVPDSVAVPSGRTVAWIWEGNSEDSPDHNVTFEDGPSSPTQGHHGDPFFRTFGGSPRTIRYRCTLHSTSFTQGEVGVVIVR